jgi:ubiquinone/menaquinone biosynthesis C-methylase UbiE
MDELARIRAEYARRADDPRLKGRYSFSRPEIQFEVQTRERAVMQMLQRVSLLPLANLDLLDVGCGTGGMLLDLLRWGADPARICGCDLLFDRIVAARGRLPEAVSVVVADGGRLVYPAARFDLVLQCTVFTSVLDDELRQCMAREMWRVLRPGGAVLWYDFHSQARSQALRPIGPKEVQALFPNGMLTARRVTLNPAIARRLAPVSWLGCEILARVPWLLTHDLILIHKDGSQYD